MVTEIHYMPDDVIEALPTRLSIQLAALTLTTESQFNLYQTRSKPLDRRWNVQITSSDMTEDHWRDLEAFFDEVDGTSGTFSFWIPNQQIPQGIATGIGEIRTEVRTRFTDNTIFEDGTSFVEDDVWGYIEHGISRGADNILIGNLMANRRVLIRGDFFSILHGPRRIPTLYRVKRDAHSDNRGFAWTQIAPPLRFPVAVNDPINFIRPRGLFHYAEQPTMDLEYPALGNTDLSLVENFEPLYEDQVIE